MLLKKSGNSINNKILNSSLKLTVVVEITFYDFSSPEKSNKIA